MGVAVKTPIGGGRKEIGAILLVQSGVQVPPPSNKPLAYSGIKKISLCPRAMTLNQSLPGFVIKVNELTVSELKTFRKDKSRHLRSVASRHHIPPANRFGKPECEKLDKSCHHSFNLPPYEIEKCGSTYNRIFLHLLKHRCFLRPGAPRLNYLLYHKARPPVKCFNIKK